VHSAEHGYFDPDYFDIDQLDVPAIRVKLDTLEYVVFPYMKHLPIDHVPEEFQGQRALEIDKGIATLRRLPEGNRAENLSVEQYDLQIRADGSIGVNEHRSIRGYQAYLMRERLTRLDSSETRDAIRESITYTEGDLTHQMRRYSGRAVCSHRSPTSGARSTSLTGGTRSGSATISSMTRPSRSGIPPNGP
jgi:hypothetical protein